MKVRLPRFDDKVDKLHGVGRVTAKKLCNIRQTVTSEEMVQKHGDVKLPPPELLYVTEGTAVKNPVMMRHTPAAHTLIMPKQDQLCFQH